MPGDGRQGRDRIPRLQLEEGFPAGRDVDNRRVKGKVVIDIHKE